MSNHQGDGNHDYIEIKTLGNFSVYASQKNLTDKHGTSMKIWELFKYLLTFRDELVLPEKIIFSLWPDADYTDPKRTLRALVFRLRKVLNGEDTNENDRLIVFSHGCYKFNSKNGCMIDIDQFESLFHQAYAVSKVDAVKAAQLFQEVVNMYKGDYLSETSEHEWLIPARNHYRRIFLQSLYETCDFLKEKKDFTEIIQVCEKALKYEMFEEEIHYRYIEALAGAGKIKQARDHYEYIAGVFEREMGVKPSASLQRLYGLLFGEMVKTGHDLTLIEESLKEEFFDSGAILCDSIFFKGLHQLEKNRSERYGQNTFVGVLTLTQPDFSLPVPKLLQEGMKNLKLLLQMGMRKGDVITQWNEAQFLLNMQVLNVEQANRALERIRQRFTTLYRNTNLILNTKVQDTLPPQKFVSTH